MTFQRASTPRQGQSCKHRIFVAVRTPVINDSKALRWLASTSVSQASSCCPVRVSHHAQKRFHQVVGGLSTWIGLPKSAKMLLLFFLQIGWLAKKEKGALVAQIVPRKRGKLEKLFNLFVYHFFDQQGCVRVLICRVCHNSCRSF